MSSNRILTLIGIIALPFILCQCGDDKGTAGDGENDPAPSGQDNKPNKPGADLDPLSKSMAKGAEIRNLANMRQYHLAAFTFSVENGGAFPATIEEVKSASGIGEDLKLKDALTGKDGLDPVYFPGLTDSDDGNSILFACPFQNPGGKRSIVRLSGVAESIPEEDYQKQVAAQGGGS